MRKHDDTGFMCMINEIVAIRQHLSKPMPNAVACGCMGPQRGEPLCPCAMRWVEIVDGKYYQILENRTLEGIKHDAKYIGNVGDKFGLDACPENRDECKNLQLVKTRAYWLDYTCNLCGYKTSISKKKK